MLFSLKTFNLMFMGGGTDAPKSFNFKFMGNSDGASSPLSGINEGSSGNSTIRSDGAKKNTQLGDDNGEDNGGDNGDEEWYVIGLENKEIKVVQDPEETEYEWKVGPFPNQKKAREWADNYSKRICG